jgi:hypothetical protein
MNKEQIEKSIVDASLRIEVRRAYCRYADTAKHRWLLENAEKELIRLQRLLKRCGHG